MKNRYVSIGYDCETKFQIDRCTGDEDHHLFDWIVTPENSFDFIGKDNDDFLSPGNWDIVGVPGNEGIRVRDKYSGLLFQHEFDLIDGRIDPDRVEGHLATAKEKFIYLKSKTIRVIKEQEKCVLIRAGDRIVTLDEAIDKINQIRQVFKPINPNIKVVIASSSLEAEFHHPEFLILKFLPCSEWRGDFASWDRLFMAAEKLL
jgi:hypothetical protein